MTVVTELRNSNGDIVSITLEDIRKARTQIWQAPRPRDLPGAFYEVAALDRYSWGAVIVKGVREFIPGLGWVFEPEVEIRIPRADLMG